MTARPASESVSADVTCRVPAGSRFVTAVSCSRSAATKALDSTYLTWVVAAARGRERRVAAADERLLAALVLGFATVCVDELCRDATLKPDVRPILEGVTGL